MRPQTFRVGNGIFLPNITFSNVTCYDPAKKWTWACDTHPQNCCSSVSFRNSTAYPLHCTHIHASSARACRFAFVVCGSALWKLGHMQPEWHHHRRNSVKHLPRLSLLVPRKDLSAALAHIAYSLLLAAPPYHPSHVFSLCPLALTWMHTGGNSFFCKSGFYFIYFFCSSVSCNAFHSDSRVMHIS